MSIPPQDAKAFIELMSLWKTFSFVAWVPSRGFGSVEAMIESMTHGMVEWLGVKGVSYLRDGLTYAWMLGPGELLYEDVEFLALYHFLAERRGWVTNGGAR